MGKKIEIYKTYTCPHCGSTMLGTVDCGLNTGGLLCHECKAEWSPNGEQICESKLSRKITCMHCGKEIQNKQVHGELCPKQKPVNGVPLSHGLSLDDHMLLEAREKANRG